MLRTLSVLANHPHTYGINEQDVPLRAKHRHLGWQSNPLVLVASELHGEYESHKKTSRSVAGTRGRLLEPEREAARSSTVLVL